jgi:hypothetical protein
MEMEATKAQSAQAKAESWVTCPVCGHHYNAAANPSCSGCPLHQGCATTCCPNCGVSNINLAHSKSAGWIRKIFKGA